jgi:hypothetical protein
MSEEEAPKSPPIPASNGVATALLELQQLTHLDCAVSFVDLDPPTDKVRDAAEYTWGSLEKNSLNLLGLCLHELLVLWASTMLQTHLL